METVREQGCPVPEPLLVQQAGPSCLVLPAGLSWVSASSLGIFPLVAGQV